ncbi:hypothetical protein ZWY2020_032150 [Hordeum vulgare]|nr:hypothetical protein ZWY2020_032150 [Hordeum vulgare]
MGAGSEAALVERPAAGGGGSQVARGSSKGVRRDGARVRRGGKSSSGQASGAFLDAQIARVAARCDDTSETADTIEVEPAISPVRTTSPRYELPDMPEGYVMEGEIAQDFLACKDSYDVEKLLCKWKEKSWNARMKYDPKFATSPIFVTAIPQTTAPEIDTLTEAGLALVFPLKRKG